MVKPSSKMTVTIKVYNFLNVLSFNMTNKKEELSNPKIFGMLIVVVVASVLVVAAVSPQNAMATICPPMCDEDIAVEEAAEAGNATMMADSGMNQTTTSNMTGTN